MEQFERQKRQLIITMTFDIATKSLLISGRQNPLLSGLLSFGWECKRKETVRDV